MGNVHCVGYRRSQREDIGSVVIAPHCAASFLFFFGFSTSASSSFSPADARVLLIDRVRRGPLPGDDTLLGTTFISGISASESSTYCLLFGWRPRRLDTGGAALAGAPAVTLAASSASVSAAATAATLDFGALPRRFGAAADAVDASRFAVEAADGLLRFRPRGGSCLVAGSSVSWSTSMRSSPSAVGAFSVSFSFPFPFPFAFAFMLLGRSAIPAISSMPLSGSPELASSSVDGSFMLARARLRVLRVLGRGFCERTPWQFKR